MKMNANVSLRMMPGNFNELLKLIETDIQKQNTHSHDAIPAKIKLTAILRFLATGEGGKGDTKET